MAHWLGTREPSFAVCEESKGNVADLACLPGIDASGPLEDFNGDEEMYTNFLRSFRDKYAGVDEEISSALAAGETELAHRQAHTLKGLAGQFGANRLFSAAEELEIALRDGGLDGKDELLEIFSKELRVVMEGLKPL